MGTDNAEVAIKGILLHSKMTPWVKTRRHAWRAQIVLFVLAALAGLAWVWVAIPWSPLLETGLLSIFILSVLILGKSFSGRYVSHPVSLLRNAVPAQTDIQSFVKGKYGGGNSQYTLFCEQTVV